MPGEEHHVIPSKVRGRKVPPEVSEVLDKIHTRLGDTIPVSKFQPGGEVQLGMTQWDKRGVAASVPVVDLDKCTQCNAYVESGAIGANFQQCEHSRRRKLIQAPRW